MAKTKISEYSTTNSSNTDINSINIDEGCAPSGINNAIREVMVHLKNWQTNASGDGATFASLVVQGTGSFTGAVTMSAGATLSGTNTLSGSNIISGNINSSGSANTFSGGVVHSGTNTFSGSVIISGNINSSGTTNTFSGGNILSGTNTLSGATVLAAQLGTSASPSIYFTSDTNTGIFSPTADTVAVATGGSERVRVDSSGNVGIGTTTTSEGKLTVNGGSGTSPTIRLNGGASANDNALLTSKYNLILGCNADANIAGRAIAFVNGSTEYMRIDSSGNVGIGTTSPAQRLHVVGTSSSGIRLDGGSSPAAVLEMLADATTSNGVVIAATYTGSGSYGPMKFNTGGSERMRIDSSGNVGVGITPSAWRTSNSEKVIQFDTGSVYCNAGNDIYLNSNWYLNSSAQSIYIETDFATSYSQQDGNHIWYTAPSGTAGNAITFTERARITSDGVFVVGDTVTYPNGASTVFYVRNTASDWSSAFRNSNATPYGLRIDYSAATPNGTGNQFLYCNDSTAARAEIRSNGGLANYSANNVNLASDQRLKKDISPLATSWDKVKAIEVVNFRYKDCNEGDPLLYGVIAQQVQPIVPELVVVTQGAKEAVEAKEAVLDEEGNVVEPAVEAKEATPEYFGIREQPMYWLAIKALQEAMTRIEALESEVAAMKAK